MEGIWEGVLLAEVPHLGKPGVLDAVVENMYTMLEEDAIIWRRVNWCLWSRAGAGREPERKCRAGAGVRGWRRWSLCSVSLLWTDSTLISAGESRREARPLNNLGAE